MAPFVEGERVLEEGEIHKIKQTKFGDVRQTLFIRPHGYRLILRIENLHRPMGGGSAEIILGPMESIEVAGRKIEWKEE